MKNFLKNKLCPLILFVVLVFNGGCKNSVGSMIDDYNSKYSVTYLEPEGPVPGEGRFKETELLLDKYFVCENETLNLCAPKDCKKYEWDLRNTKKAPNDKITINMIGTYGYNSRRFLLNPGFSKMAIGNYKLRLTITDKEGNRFSDICEIVIYKDISKE